MHTHPQRLIAQLSLLRSVSETAAGWCSVKCVRSEHPPEFLRAGAASLPVSINALLRSLSRHPDKQSGFKTGCSFPKRGPCCVVLNFSILPGGDCSLRLPWLRVSLGDLRWHTHFSALQRLSDLIVVTVLKVYSCQLHTPGESNPCLLVRSGQISQLYAK